MLSCSLGISPWLRIRVSKAKAAEVEEREFSEKRAPEKWLCAPPPLVTYTDKPLLEIASVLIGIFAQCLGVLEDGTQVKYYHVLGLIGIATGMQVNSFRHTILATLPLTLSPVGFMNEIMGQRDNEKTKFFWPQAIQLTTARLYVLLAKKASVQVYELATMKKIFYVELFYIFSQ